MLHFSGVTFSLTGYDSIPTDGSGRVLITDINPHGDTCSNEDALICRSGITITGLSGTGDWYLHHSQLTADDDYRIESSDI